MDAFFAFAIVFLGVFSGCRSLSPLAIVAWAVHFGVLNLHHTRFGWMGAWPTVIIFTLMAAGELVGDKLPNTPSRTAPGPLVFRIITGALCGSVMANAGGQLFWVGALLGAVGAVAGTFGGYQIRMRTVKALKSPDWPVAVAEDLVTIFGSILIVTRF